MPEIETPTRSEQPLKPSQSALPLAEHLSASNQRIAPTEYTPHALSLIATALLAACGGGGGGGGGGSTSAPGFNNAPKAQTDEEAARFLMQGQFAAPASEVSAVRSTDFASYLQQQFAKPMSQTGWDWLESRGYGLDATLDKYVYSTTIADFMIWSQLMGAPDSMRKRMALALSEFFVVSLNSMEIDWRGYAIAAYWDLLNQHAFGNFRDLLEAITLNPAMGYFLNTRGNQKEDGKGRLPDENYAREVMQLFTVGVYQLNLDGSVQTDASGKKRETYDSDDVSQLARVFTGYDYDSAYSPSSANGLPFPGQSYKVWAREYARSPMKLDANKHSISRVRFLTADIAESTSGAVALKTALDTLFNHPNVGPFFGRQMIQRLVTSNPSPAYVARVASAFNNNGAGVRGDLKAVWAAILLDDEARGSASLSNPKFGKLREPILRFVNWSRSFNAVSKTGSWKIFDLSDPSNSLGQSPLHSPSVFNFFRPGYVPPGTAFAPDAATAPEFQIVNETTVGSYINYIDGIIRNGMNTPRPSTAEVVYTDYVLDIEGDYSTLLALINNTANTDAEALRVAQSFVSRLNVLLCAGQLSTGSVTTITNALRDGMRQRSITSASNDSTRRDLVAAAILMVMASPDYLIQK